MYIIYIGRQERSACLETLVDFLLSPGPVPSIHVDPTDGAQGFMASCSPLSPLQLVIIFLLTPADSRALWNYHTSVYIGAFVECSNHTVHPHGISYLTSGGFDTVLSFVVSSLPLPFPESLMCMYVASSTRLYGGFSGHGLALPAASFPVTNHAC